MSQQTKVVWSVDGGVVGKVNPEDIAKTCPDALRIVYSKEHSSEITQFIDEVQGVTESHPYKIPLMIDVADRTRAQVGGLEGPLEISYGDKIILSREKGKGDIWIRVEDWEAFFQKDVSIYFGYGAAMVCAESVSSDKVEAVVKLGGSVQPDVEVHVPATKESPVLSELKDIDIAPLASRGIDYVVIPGVTSAREVQIARKRIQSHADSMPWLILKVDSKAVYENLEELLEVVDGIVISRKSLGLTMDPATVPMITKEIIQLSSECAKPVFVSSEMLGSMRFNPTPTRAEVSDIANAVMDGADGVVLTEEISHGKFSTKAYDLAQSAIKDLENNNIYELNWDREDPKIENEFDAIAYQALKTAERLDAKAIVCITETGNTPLKIASFRSSLPIVAVTFEESTRRRLSLIRGVQGVLLKADPKMEEILPEVNDLLKRQSWLKTGDIIVFVSVTISSMGREESNLLTIQRLE